MKKRLLLTLLPLAFLVAACSGANRPASSSQTPNPSTTSQPSGDTSSDESSAEPSSEPSGDGEGHSSLIGEGYEIKVGDLYYTLEERAEPDQGRNASYFYEDLDLTAGDKISVYLDGGEALAIWAEADATNGVYPNYDERPGPDQHTEFTVTETATGDAYFHINSDDSYSLWLTPNQSGGEGGEGGEGGQTTGEKYTILVDDTEVAVTHNTAPLDPSYDEYYALDVAVQEGQRIALRDNEAENTPVWTITNLDSASVGFEVQDGELVCTESGSYDIYLKFKYEADQIYIGAHS